MIRERTTGVAVHLDAPELPEGSCQEGVNSSIPSTTSNEGTPTGERQNQCVAK